ncbi:TetR family transcriptional regulator [Rhodococcus sp. NPDC057014]|uniref:TetR family transcriptional regulator n=1 Tax=unclassified Rhodococcus (in: high G+C Gram-positive bacteria) TaxID=192944 RepID=UPI003645D5A1
MPIQSLLLDVAEGHFARRGVLGTRLADIRHEAGVSVGAVYHHFPNKEELYVQVWLRALAGRRRAGRPHRGRARTGARRVGFATESGVEGHDHAAAPAAARGMTR